MRPLIGEPEGVAFANDPFATATITTTRKDSNYHHTDANNIYNNDTNCSDTTNRTNRVPLCDQTTTSFQSTDLTTNTSNRTHHRNGHRHSYRQRNRTRTISGTIDRYDRDHRTTATSTTRVSHHPIIPTTPTGKTTLALSRWTTTAVVSLLPVLCLIATYCHAAATNKEQDYYLPKDVPSSTSNLLTASPASAAGPTRHLSLLNNTLDSSNSDTGNSDTGNSNDFVDNANAELANENLDDAGKQQDQQQEPQSFADWWSEFWSRQPFPSGYTQSSITLIACLLTTIIFLIVVGNLLVCIAIFTEKSLKPTQNWFIASLAVSDMLLGLVVMPFSLARELMGFWIFGSLWCDIHEAVDVLLTTASINTLCLISLDRYWSITQAVSYLKKRTPRRGAFMIAFVWVFSAAVSLPPLFGWKKQSPNIVANSNSNSNNNNQNSLPATNRSPTDQSEESEFTDSSFGNRPDNSQWNNNAQQDDGSIVGDTNNVTGNYFKRDLSRQLDHIPSLPGNDPKHKQANNSITLSKPSQQQQAIATVTTTTKPISSSTREQHYLNQRNNTNHRQPSSTFDYYSTVPTTLQRNNNNYLLRPSQVSPPPALLLLQAEPPFDLQQQQQQLQTEYPSCQLSDDIGYVLYSALGSFYIPCAVMVFTYIKIFLAARSRARRTINKQANAKRLAARRTVASGGGHGTTGKLVGETHSMPMRGPVQASAAGAARTDSNKHQAAVTNSEPLMRAGKLVIVERRKSGAAGALSPIADRSSPQQAAGKSPGEMSKPQPDEPSGPCTMVTSSAKPASPSVLGNTDGTPPASVPAAASAIAEANGKNNLTGSASAETIGNESSLITVMSASMVDVPITRFNFNRPASSGGKAAAAEKDGASDKPQEPQSTGDHRASALLQAIQRADTKDLSTATEILSSAAADQAVAAVATDASASGASAKQKQTTVPDIVCCKQQQREEQDVVPGGFNSTNETCFMTIEEDSDTFDGQTGRTITMVSGGGNGNQQVSTCRHRSCGHHRGARSQPSASNTDASITKTIGSDADGVCAGEIVSNDTDDVVCNNIACIRRQQRHQRHHQPRSSSSYCGSSMTINDEEDEEDEDVDVDVEDESVGDDLLTDDCNGYSGSCALDQYCSAANAPPGVCPHCDVCQQQQQHQAGAEGEGALSPQHLSVSLESPVKAIGETGQAASNQRHNYLRSHPRKQSQCPSDIEGQSLTGDDNISLTGYRSNEDVDVVDDGDDVDDVDVDNGSASNGSSSASGHDVLDATTDSRGYGQDEPSISDTQHSSAHHHSHSHHHRHHPRHRCCRAGQHQQPGASRKGVAGSLKASKQQTATSAAAGADQVATGQRKKSSLGLRLTRLGSSVPPLRWSHQSSGGLLALAAESQQLNQQQQQQQQQQQLPPQTVTVIPAPSSAPTGGTRNLKALRQNFFLKLNQLAAKSAAKQSKKHDRPPPDKSSIQRSYEHSVDGATTSNALSYTEYPPETTIDDYEPQTSGDSKTSGTKQRDSCAVASGVESNNRSEADDLSAECNRAKSPGQARTSDSQKANRAGASGADGSANAKTASTDNKNDDRALLLRTPQMRDANRHMISSDSSLMVGSSTTITNNNNNINRNLNTDNHNKQSSRLDVGIYNKQQHLQLTNSRKLPSSLHSSTNINTSAIGATGATAGYATSAGSGAAGHRSGGGGMGGGVGGHSHRAYLASDNERHKRKLAKARERRATLILGLIMAAFICSWLPFFTFYVLRALCTACREYISPRFEAFIFWMGYCNSAINPIIYTIFNRDFRKAFRKILFKCL